MKELVFGICEHCGVTITEENDGGQDEMCNDCVNGEFH